MASSSACVLNSIPAAARSEGLRNSSHCQSAAGAGAGASFKLHGGAGLGLGSSLKSLRIPEPRTSSRIVAMATESSSTENAANELLKNIQEAWEKTDDKLAIGGLGFAALIVLWASTGLISAIDKLPIIPTFFELVGLLFSGWFVYRYLLFKPDREELLKKIDETKGKITGDK